MDRQIVRCFGYCEDEKSIYIITEAMERNLCDLLYGKNRQILSSEDKFRIALQIARGIAILKCHMIIHRDIKSKNILIDKDLNVKLCDFGISKLKDGQGTNTITLMQAGTLQWMAPEIFVSSKYGFASDIYSFGIVLYELVEMKEPYPDFDTIPPFEFMKSIIDGKRPWILPSHDPLIRKLSQIQQSCLLGNPNERISIEGAHDILQSFFNLKEKVKDEIQLKKYFDGAIIKTESITPRNLCSISRRRSSLHVFFFLSILISFLVSIGGIVWTTLDNGSLNYRKSGLREVSIAFLCASFVASMIMMMSICFNIRCRDEKDLTYVENCCVTCVGCRKQKNQ